MTDHSVRFEFGQNWKNFSKTVDEASLQGAIDGLKRLLPTDLKPAGLSFLDIGSGSGLHSVAATRLGFSTVTATDYDLNSVNATKSNAARFGAKVDAFRDDILNSEINGQFDVVYSWGVLHHTGDMKQALKKAAGLVKPGGLLIIALYVRTPLCGMWEIVKRTYSAGGPMRQKIMSAGYISALKLRTITQRGKLARGMNFQHDAIDWLGGYPYESASHDEVVALTGRQYELQQNFSTNGGVGIFGTGCGEYVFKRVL